LRLRATSQFRLQRRSSPRSSFSWATMSSESTTFKPTPTRPQSGNPCPLPTPPCPLAFTMNLPTAVGLQCVLQPLLPRLPMSPPPKCYRHRPSMCITATIAPVSISTACSALRPVQYDHFFCVADPYAAVPIDIDAAILSADKPTLGSVLNQLSIPSGAFDPARQRKGNNEATSQAYHLRTHPAPCHGRPAPL
jgi:hypothetical protein